jgi:formylglycine-generating enzyme required for sulfatase activity
VIPPDVHFTSFQASEDNVYKVNLVAIDSIGTSLIGDIYPYDRSGGGGTGFKLPYRYASTWRKPASFTGPYAGSLAGIGGGIFSMGDIWADSASGAENLPLHEVVVPSFLLGAKEVTNGQLVKFLNSLDSVVLVPDAMVMKDSLFYRLEPADSIILNDSGVPLDTMVVFHPVRVDTAIPVGRLITILSGNGVDTLVKNSINIFYSDSGDSFFCVTQKQNHPATRVSWACAALYCNWISQKEGLTPCYHLSQNSVYFDSLAPGYRLPTEAEYEYAHSTAFFGVKQRYPWGYSDDKGKYQSDTAITGVVGSKGGYFGLYDMSGNAMEWCHDFSDLKLGASVSDYYTACREGGVTFNPRGPASGTFHALRGGSHTSAGVGSAQRFVYTNDAYKTAGFRIARNVR